MKKFFMRTARLGFSVWTEDDISEAQELWGNLAVTKFISANGKMSMEQIHQRLHKECETYAVYLIQYWPIYSLENYEHVGCCGLRPYESEKNVLEIGFHLKEKHWGKGLAEEASRAVIDYAFDVLGMDMLFAGHHPDNIASSCLLKKLGFIYSQDSFYPPTGLFHPSYLLASQAYKTMRRKVTMQMYEDLS